VGQEENLLTKVSQKGGKMSAVGILIVVALVLLIVFLAQRV
jgi:hypothetical protein